MGTLSTKQRNKLPSGDFALSGGRYPINDVAHARNALARAAQEHNAGKLSNSEYHQVVAKANGFLNKHETGREHANTVAKK